HPEYKTINARFFSISIFSIVTAIAGMAERNAVQHWLKCSDEIAIKRDKGFIFQLAGVTFFLCREISRWGDVCCLREEVVGIYTWFGYKDRHAGSIGYRLAGVTQNRLKRQGVARRKCVVCCSGTNF